MVVGITTYKYTYTQTMNDSVYIHLRPQEPISLGGRKILWVLGYHGVIWQGIGGFVDTRRVGYHGLWVLKGMGYCSVDCNRTSFSALYPCRSFERG